MAKATFFITSKRRLANIRLRFQVGRDVDIWTKTNFTINPERWSKKTSLPKGGGPGEKELKNKLSQIKYELENIKELPKTKDEGRQLVESILNPEAAQKNINDTLVDYFDVYLNWRRGEISQGFTRRAKSIKKFVERMERHENKKYRIKDVDANFLFSLKAFAEKCGYAKNTTAGFFKVVKIICNHAANNSNGKIQTSPGLSRLTMNFTSPENIYLTFAELDKIKALDLSERLDNARDWLLISCFTGQRVSDFMRFTDEMLRSEGGTLLIEFTQVKTRKQIAIPVHPEVKRILDKRSGAFPRAITDQRYNDYIKEVCKSADLSELKLGRKRQPGKNSPTVEGMFPKYELIASHVGRRSFATNFYGQIPTSILTAATGHATEKQFLDYIGKSETERAKELANYWNK